MKLQIVKPTVITDKVERLFDENSSARMVRLYQWIKSRAELSSCRVVEFKAGWKKGSVSQKKRLIRALIENIEVRPGALGLFYLVHEEDPAGSTEARVHRPTFRPKKEMTEASDFQNKKAVGNFVIPMVGFDVDVKNGVLLGN